MHVCRSLGLAVSLHPAHQLRGLFSQPMRHTGRAHQALEPDPERAFGVRVHPLRDGLELRHDAIIGRPTHPRRLVRERAQQILDAPELPASPPQPRSRSLHRAHALRGVGKAPSLPEAEAQLPERLDLEWGAKP